MSIKWRLSGLFLGMTGLALLLFWIGQSAQKGSAWHEIDVGVTFLALCFPAIIVFIYSSQLSRRLKRINFAVQQLTEGSFGSIDYSDSTDEIGEITTQFNTLSRHVEMIVENGTQEAHKMEAILAGMQEGVVAVDQVGQVVLVNAAAERIFERQETGRKLNYLFDLTYDSKLEHVVRGVLSGGRSVTREAHIAHKIVESQINPVSSKSGEARGAVIVFHDVTELRRLEQLRTEFVANVSHELRTPLTSIKGFIETLLDGAADDQALRQRFLKIIQAETLRLQRLVEDLLTLARIEGQENHIRTNSSQFSYVHKAYEKIKPVIDSFAQTKGIKVEIEIKDNLPPLLIGEDLLSQLFLNLLENAVKYTSKGRVWFRAWADKEHIYLEVGDTGCGIPEETLSRIFERFYRVDKARSREQGGTGLGLSIVKHIVESMGGKIDVSSEIGAGTIFTCNLPQADWRKQ